MYAVHCMPDSRSLYAAERQGHDNINELSFLFLHERLTSLTHSLYVYQIKVTSNVIAFFSEFSNKACWAFMGVPARCYRKEKRKFEDKMYICRKVSTILALLGRFTWANINTFQFSTALSLLVLCYLHIEWFLLGSQSHLHSLSKG